VGNRSLVMDMFSFVDVFFIVEPPVSEGGKCVAYENDLYELLLFVEASGVEVFVKGCMMGWFSLDNV
jgi:hypothetical protein